MRYAAKVDGQGFYLEPVLVDGPLPPGHAEITPFVGLHWPRWNGAAWVEGMPQAGTLAAARAAKRGEMEAAFADETARSFGGGSAWVGVMVGVLATDARDARIAALKTGTVKLRDRLAAVEAATTVEAVGAVSW